MNGPPPGPARAPRLGEFACRCGQILPPRTSRTGRDFECSCGRKGYVEADQDENRNPVVKPVFTHEPAAAAPPVPAAPEPAPAPVPADGEAWRCPCGEAIEAAAALRGAQPSCPRCGRGVTLRRVRASNSMMVSMRPVFTAAPPSPPPSAAAPSVPSAPAAPAPPAPPSAPTAVFREIEEPAPDEIVACACGERLYASPADAGRSMECPTCLKISRIEGARGALRLRPIP